MDLLNTYTPRSELQVNTALSLISTLYKSLQHRLSLFPACCVLISRSLATVFNSGNSTASRSYVRISQPPVSSQSQSHIATDGQSVRSLGVEPHLGLMTRYLLLFDSYTLVFVGGLSDERTGLSFVHAASPYQHSLSRVRVPWDSRP
jgi:hypothetical protein